MKELVRRFYQHQATGLFHQGKFSIARWFGNIEFQILMGNQPIVSCKIIDGYAVIEKITDSADKYLPSIREVVSNYHPVRG